MKYEQLKPNPRDRFYVDPDTESGCFGVFGTESGFCYGLYSDRGEAEACARTYSASSPMKGQKMPSLRLTSYNMGANSAEPDFDLWIVYVGRHIDNRCGFEVDVDAFRFGNGPARDEITDATPEQRETIREALESLWAEWCADPSN